MARRLLRLVPALAVLLVATAAISVAAGASDRDTVLRSCLVAAAYLADVWILVLGRALAQPVAHLWTLSIEEHFYLAWPLSLTLLTRHLRQRVPVVLVGSVLGLELIRWCLILGHAGLDDKPLTWVEALLAGCWLGTQFHRRRLLASWLVPWALPVGGGALMLLSLVDERHLVLHRLSLTAVVVASTLAVASAVEPSAAASRLLASPTLGWLGRRSYGIYLWHLPLLVVARRVDFGPPRVVTTVLALGIALLVAATSYRMVEVPFLRRKPPRRAPGRAMPSSSSLS